MGGAVLIAVISTIMLSNAIAHRWSVHNALQNNIEEIRWSLTNVMQPPGKQPLGCPPGGCRLLLTP
jgi:hypothetical protein